MAKDAAITKKKVIKKVAKKQYLKVRRERITKNEKDLLLLHQTLKLQIELVPSSCFWKNVRSNIKGSEWNKIRFKVYERADNLCEVCGGKGTKHPVECHEVWIYDDTTRIQHLSHFQAICPLCHEVKHIGFASLRGNGKRAFSRFIEINKLSETTAREIKSAVFKQWRIRSKKTWKRNVDHLLEWGITPN